MPLMEFTYNNNCYASIDMTPFKALHGRKCIFQLSWFHDGDEFLVGLDL